MTELVEEEVILNQKPKTNKYCNQLLGLYFTEPDCPEDKYIQAFSFDIQILQSMIENQVPNIDKEYYSIQPVKVLYHYVCQSEEEKKSLSENLQKSKEKKFKNKKFKNIKGLIFDYSTQTNKLFDELEFPIYGYNSITDDFCQQVLLCTGKPDELKFQSNGISSNPIQIDTFYEESILNA